MHPFGNVNGLILQKLVKLIPQDHAVCVCVVPDIHPKIGLLSGAYFMLFQSYNIMTFVTDLKVELNMMVKVKLFKD